MSKQRTYLIALLDKVFPPMHSFVDGMLCEAYPDATGHQVILLVERNDAYPKIMRYKGVVCLNVLPRRRGVGRLKGPWASWFYTRRLLRKISGKNGMASILVRNDPMFLIGALPLKRTMTGSCIVFQSSFPHEMGDSTDLKRHVARWLLARVLRRTDGLLAVSKGGAERVRAYSPDLPVGVIPLAVDKQMLQVKKSKRSSVEKLRVLYLGTHDPSRALDVVFEGCEAAVRDGVPMEILSVGGGPQHLRLLNAQPVVQRLVENQVLRFIPPVPRTDVTTYLAWADIGLSLIPPTEKYQESSPTKLAEYMGAGVLCLANYGIESQEEIIKDSAAGVLTNFDATSIANALVKIWHERDDLPALQQKGRAYVEKHFTYGNFVHVLDELLWQR